MLTTKFIFFSLTAGLYHIFEWKKQEAPEIRFANISASYSRIMLISETMLRLLFYENNTTQFHFYDISVLHYGSHLEFQNGAHLKLGSASESMSLTHYILANMIE